MVEGCPAGRASRWGGDAGRRPGLVANIMIVPYWTEKFDNLSLDVDASPAQMTGQLHPQPADATVSPNDAGRPQLAITLPISLADGNKLGATLQWQSSTQSDFFDRPATVARESATTISVLTPMPELPVAEWDILLALNVPHWAQPRALGLKTTVTSAGCVAIEMATRSPKGAAGAAANPPTQLAADATTGDERRKVHERGDPSPLIGLRRRVPLRLRKFLVRLRDGEHRRS